MHLEIGKTCRAHLEITLRKLSSLYSLLDKGSAPGHVEHLGDHNDN